MNQSIAIALTGIIRRCEAIKRSVMSTTDEDIRQELADLIDVVADLANVVAEASEK